ncbi:MAG: hypothetical protein ACWGMY_01610 [Hyphomicrobiaceae bacterium]
MLKNRKFLLSGTALAMGGAGVSMPAATAGIYDRVDVRRAEQAQRIQQGIRSGELTRAEAAKLKAQQAQIRHLERKAERDGRNTRSERARINAAQNASSRSIYAEKHDSQDRNRASASAMDGTRALCLTRRGKRSGSAGSKLY